MFIFPVALAIFILAIPCVLLVWVIPRLKSRSALVILCWLVAPMVALALVPLLPPLIMMYRDFNRGSTLGMGLLKTLSGAVLIFLPSVLAAGMGSTLRHQLSGCIMAWCLTPVIMGITEFELGHLVSFFFRNPNVHPMGQMPIAFTGVLTGLISAIGASVIRARQNPLLQNSDTTRQRT